jgi:glucose-1-phosphate cytidylyltransferase
MFEGESSASGIMPPMKVVILAGGLGSRLAEETEIRPKPMVEIGDRPMLWHIMKHYAASGFQEFVVALGYKGDEIKRFFVDYLSLAGDLTVRMDSGVVERHAGDLDAWTVHLVETGAETGTGGRVGRLAPWLGTEPFMLTYGDGVSNVDLAALLAFHKASGKLATVTAVRPPARFGGLAFGADRTVTFTEKPQVGEGWINGGFMVIEPAVLDRIQGDAVSFEADVLEQLSQEGQLVGYAHEGFWQPMDTLRDVRYLRSLWAAGTAPWVTWG